jgi:hypothetical protein
MLGGYPVINGNVSFKQLNRSGFPFQLRVEEEVRASSDIHHWSIASREHPWTNPESGVSGFVDIVLKHDQFVTFRLVVECKRMRSNDERQLYWFFLLPNTNNEITGRTSCLEVEGEEAANEWRDIRIWDDVLLRPGSVESEFCILPNDEQRRQPILESLASELLEAVEGLAEEEVRIAKSQDQHGRVRLFMFPAIVTNAQLMVCQFRPEDISIEDGTLELSNASVFSVPFIRFRKSLARDFPTGRYFDLESAQRARQRTIFVVNAASISEFLAGWEMRPQGITARYAIQNHALWG